VNRSTSDSSRATDKTPNHLSWFARLQRWRWRKRKAAQDYRNARGSAHRELLMRAAHRLQKCLDVTNQALDQHNHTLRQVIDKRDVALNQALSRYLVETYLTIIDGIGPVLRDRILTHVFRNKLDDLRSASRLVSGIGDSKQLGINAWITVFKKQFPSMLQEEFPGKTKIMQQYEASIKKLEAEIVAAGVTQDALREILASVQTAIEQLSSVTEEDFYQALLYPDNVDPSLERYRSGVFAPWEPAPEWFKLAINEDWEG
jgi:hypothetical protein